MPTNAEVIESLARKLERVRILNDLYRTPIKFAVQSDCRPPARYFPGGITVNPGGLQYKRVQDAGRVSGTYKKV